MMNLKSHIKTALGYFLIAALLGVVLRSFKVFEIPITYKFFVHTHSHIALLGWVYLVLTTLIYKLFVQSPVKDKKYKKIFWFTQLTLVGMLLTFPFQGYALFSIVFSTLFLFASYWFFWFFKKYTKREYKKTNSYKCINAALWFMVLSSIGPWSLGIIMNTLGAQSIWYRLSIYFYLHFQYNGWMILALFGIFLNVLEQHQIVLSHKTFKKFFWNIVLGISLSFFLSTLFTAPSIVFNILGGAGAIAQLVAFGILLRVSVCQKVRLKALFSSFQYNLLKTIAVLLGVKMILQLLTAIPYFAHLATTILEFTIGYLHWTFLGVVTISLFLFLDYSGLLRISKNAYLLYFTGFITTEALIFYKGIAAWQNLFLFNGYTEVLAIGSLVILLSLILILLTNLSGKNPES